MVCIPDYESHTCLHCGQLAVCFMGASLPLNSFTFHIPSQCYFKYPASQVFQHHGCQLEQLRFNTRFSAIFHSQHYKFSILWDLLPISKFLHSFYYAVYLRPRDSETTSISLAFTLLMQGKLHLKLSDFLMPIYLLSAFNARYIIDFLTVYPSDPVEG